MKSGPPATLLPELERLLSKRPPHVAAAIRRVVSDVRPCVVLQTTRIGDVPLRGRFMDRLLQRPKPQPGLPSTASKFGGAPYAEHLSELLDGRFIGQINFEEVTQALKSLEHPIPDGIPAKGLLAVDLLPGVFRGRVRWYPEPDESRAVTPPQFEAVAKYEARIEFTGGWSLRGLEWFDAVPKGDDELWNYMNDLEVPQVDVDSRDGHKLFGHPNEVLNEHYGLEPAVGRSKAIREYALIWRIDYDRAAGFSWGTNWLYVVIHRDDLGRGTFQHAVVTGANA
jgi:hypothetical protein